MALSAHLAGLPLDMGAAGTAALGRGTSLPAHLSGGSSGSEETAVVQVRLSLAKRPEVTVVAYVTPMSNMLAALSVE